MVKKQLQVILEREQIKKRVLWERSGAEKRDMYNLQQKEILWSIIKR